MPLPQPGHPPPGLSQRPPPIAQHPTDSKGTLEVIRFSAVAPPPSKPHSVPPRILVVGSTATLSLPGTHPAFTYPLSTSKCPSRPPISCNGPQAASPTEQSSPFVCLHQQSQEASGFELPHPHLIHTQKLLLPAPHPHSSSKVDTVRPFHEHLCPWPIEDKRCVWPSTQCSVFPCLLAPSTSGHTHETRKQTSWWVWSHR